MIKFLTVAIGVLCLLAPSAASAACMSKSQARAAAPSSHIHYKVVGARRCWHSNHAGGEPEPSASTARAAVSPASRRGEPAPVPLPRPAPRMVAFEEFAQPLTPTQTVAYRWNTR